MKVYLIPPKIILAIAALSFLALYSFPANAQRNIIDVPTIEIVEKRHLFFQEQASISNRQIKSSTIFTWGLGKNFEMGFNISQLTFNVCSHTHIINIDPEKPEANPGLLLNLQKGFKLKEWAILGLGTRIGVNATRAWEEVRLLNFSYVNSRFSIPETENKFVVGSYYANKAYEGEGNYFGWMLGVEANIIEEKLSLIGDYISGTNTLSVVNLGFQISLPKKWQLAFAAQLPSPGSNNNYGGVIQIARR
jgi:hypothetical protein